MAKSLFEKYYSYFSDRYEIRFCRAEERERLVDFIDRYWKHNHALVLSPALLDWQHFEPRKDGYSFSMAICRETQEIHALQGFILSSHFDPEIRKPIRWGAIWKNREDVGEAGLGILVEQYMAQYAPAVVGIGIGLSSSSRKIGKKHGNIMGKVERYYILNPDIKDFRLAANVSESLKRDVGSNAEKTISELAEEQYLSLSDEVFAKVPVFKSKLYYVNRFFRHPIYRYHASAIMDAERPIAVLFWRVCGYQDACCLRVVDYIGTGEEMAGCGREFLKLIREHNAEFLDFMNVGIPSEYFAAGGFLNRRDSDIVLAHYYEPFLLENDDLDYEWDNHEIPPLIFKGDADMDRPNVIEVEK